jgi:imidazolonepropionase-like amidohydrolase
MIIPVATTISGLHRACFEVTGRDYPDAIVAGFNQRLEGIMHPRGAGAIVAFGTDTVAGPNSFSGRQFMAEVWALNQSLPNQAVIATLTRKAAEFVGRGAELGTLEPGKFADIILIDGDPLAESSDHGRVKVVIRRGTMVVDHR